MLSPKMLLLRFSISEILDRCQPVWLGCRPQRAPEVQPKRYLIGDPPHEILGVLEGFSDPDQPLIYRVILYVMLNLEHNMHQGTLV